MSPLIWGSVLLLIAALALVVDRLALLMLRPQRRPVGRSPEDVGLSARDWRVVGDPELSGWWMEGDEPNGPIVVLAHGWGANAGVVLPLAPAAAAVASHVVAVDIRGHGRSDESSLVSIRQFRDDLRRVVRQARLEAPHRPVVLVGHSLGGAAGSLLAAEDEGSREPADVDGLVLIAAPHDVYGTIARYLVERRLPGHLLVPLMIPFWRLRIGLPARVLNPGRALRRTRLPVLVIQPEQDTRVPVAEGHQLADASRGELKVIPGAGHSNVLQLPLTGTLVRNFLTSGRPGS